MTQNEQKPPVKRFLLPTLLILNGLLLPCSCCVLTAVLFEPHNPFLVAFVTDIQITNATHERLKVTPIGTCNAEGKRAALPIYQTREPPAYPSSQRGNFVIEPGRTIEIIYDWDDINLSEIVVEMPSGKLGQMVTDPDPTANQFHPPEPNHFVIEDIGRLQPVPDKVLRAFHKAQRPYRPWVLVAALAPWVSFAVLLVWLLRLRKLQAAPHPMKDDKPAT